MEVIFGVQARDGAIKLNLENDKVEQLRQQLEGAFSGDDGHHIIWVTDKDGREYCIPTEKIAFVEFGTEKSSRQVGFSSTS